jgi:polyisoprenoid-binding protein YceI
MKTLFVRALLAAAALSLFAPAAEASTWKIDTNHSEMMFIGRHLKFAKVRGSFKAWSGNVVLDEKDISKSTVDVSFDINSINTDNETRDNHLKSPDFFDAAKFPTATFKSTKVEKVKDNVLKLTGNLTIKDVTKPVSFEVEMSPEFKDPGGNSHRAFQGGKLTINRQDYGLKWSKAVEGLGVASDEIELEIEVELFGKKP